MIDKWHIQVSYTSVDAMIRITFFFFKQMQQEEKGGKTREKKKRKGEGRAGREDKEMGMLPLVMMEAAHLTKLCVDQLL